MSDEKDSKKVEEYLHRRHYTSLHLDAVYAHVLSSQSPLLLSTLCSFEISKLSRIT